MFLVALTDIRAFPLIELLAIAGCAQTEPTRFIPTERISAEDVRRIERTLIVKVGQLSTAELAAHDFVRPISAVAVDGNEHKLYFHREWQEGWPAGVVTHDIRTGRELRRSRIPASSDLTGDARRASGKTVFDVVRKRAYYHTRFKGQPPTGLFLVQLDLEHDAPRKVEIGTTHFAESPLLDNRILLCEGPELPPYMAQVGLLEHRAVGYLALETTTMEGPHKLPEGAFRIVGGTGEHIVSEIHREFAVLKRDGNIFVEVSRYQLADDWSSTHQLIDDVASRLVSIESKSSGPKTRNQNPNAPAWRIRIYAIPSLRVLNEINVPAIGASTLIPGASILAYIADNDQILTLLDCTTGHELRTIPLADGKINESRHDMSWKPFASLDARYIGVFSAHVIQLFGIRPEK